MWTACKIFRVPSGSYTKDSPERSVGKTCDLAFGYQGGLNAWRKFEPDRFTDAEVETFKIEWRATHPKIKQFWHDIGRAAVLAVRERGQVVHCGRIDLKSTGAFLLLKLPSGRKISYPQPRLVVSPKQRHVCCLPTMLPVVQGLPQRPGHLCRHVDRKHRLGIARDLLAAAMLRVEAAGYPIVLHVHDEIVAEVPSASAAEEFTCLMTRKPTWALELPIAASAWTGSRYCK